MTNPRSLPSLPLLLLLALAPAPPAAASQYPLDQATAIIPRADSPKLRRAGIRTTADFLAWGRSPEDRRALAFRAGLPVERITAWVLLADLMRVRGIGPDVARLLTAIGVRTLAELQRAEPGPTASAVRDANKRLHLSTNPPGAESIRYWVAEARRMAVLIPADTVPPASARKASDKSGPADEHEAWIEDVMK